MTNLESKLLRNEEQLEAIRRKISNLRQQEENLERKVLNQKATLLNLRHRTAREIAEVEDSQIESLS